MKGSVSVAHFLCAALLFAALNESLAKRPRQNFRNFRQDSQESQEEDEEAPPPRPPVRPRPMPAPLPIPRHPPFQVAPVTQAPNTLDPYACLPKYLCIIENKKGEKRTTIVHGLHPALRKAKPNVIDPNTLPKVPGGIKPFPVPVPSISETSDDEIYRDREFSDSFLQQQEMAEAMAFLEEKRRQFMYQQGIPKQKIVSKAGQKKKKTVQVEEDDKQSKESNEDEEPEKSQELSKEDEKEEDVDKSAEVSKEEKEETDKSAEKSVEKSSEKSVEVSKEEKEEPEEESLEEDSSSESLKSRSKLSKYKIKNKGNSKKRNGSFKARMDDYEDVDSLDDHLATVPWDDRLRNDTDPLKPSEIYDKLFRNVLPSFKLPSLPKIAKKIPGMAFLASDSDEDVTTTTTTTTPRPGLFKRMLNRVTGKGSSNNPPPPNSIKRRYGRPIHRHKREVLISNDEKIVKEIRDPEKQCRMIFKGCDLPYDHIMKMVSRGQVLIENDYEPTTTVKPAPTDPAVAQDDEADQAVKDKMDRKKSSKPIPQLLAQASLGGKKKFGGTGGMSMFGKNKKKPSFSGSSEEISGEFPPMMKPKKKIASLPIMPMKYQWGKPTYKINGKPNGVSDFSGGITERVPYKAPPTTTTTSTTPRPIFAATKLDKKDNSATPSLQHSVIKVNRTHAVHILSKKPYNPPKTKTRDAKGQPVSFNSVYTEIAGSSGGIHDFFDRISGAFGDGTKETARDFTSTFPGSNKDVHGNVETFPMNSKKKPPPLPPVRPSPTQATQKNKDEQSDERDDEDSGSDEDQDENEEADKDNENEDDKDEDEKNSKNKRPEKEQEQESEEEEENNDEGELNLPDNVPPHVRQAMIQDYNRKRQEQAHRGGNGGNSAPLRGGVGRPGQGHQSAFGRPGQRPHSQGKPPRGGGLLASLFS